MNKKRIITAVVMTIVLTMLLAFGVSAETETTAHWIPNADGTWSYMDANGELVKSEVGYWIEGNCYGFDENGIMYTGWVQPRKYDVDYINWSSESRNAWFYFDPASGRAPLYGYHAETGYLFNSDGEVMTNTYSHEWDEEAETQVIYVSDDAGVATKLELMGWNLVNGKWYYVGEDASGNKRLYSYDIYEIDGTDISLQTAHWLPMRSPGSTSTGRTLKFMSMPADILSMRAGFFTKAATTTFRMAGSWKVAVTPSVKRSTTSTGAAKWRKTNGSTAFTMPDPAAPC